MIALLEPLYRRRLQALRRRTGTPHSCFVLERRHGIDGVLLLYVPHTKADVWQAIKVADDWYVRYNLNYFTYLHLRKDLFALLRELRGKDAHT